MRNGISQTALLVLCLALAACKPPAPEPGIAPSPAAAPTAASPTTSAATPAAAESDEQDWAPVPTTQKRAPVTGDVDPEAPILDEDGNPYTPDSSYDRANLRPQFGRCIDASNAETPALQACGDEEYLFQRKRMMAALDIIDAAPDSVSKDRLMDEQDTYMRDTDLYCRFDPRTQGQGHMLNAQSCRINRLANRADALERVIRRAGKADAKKN